MILDLLLQTLILYGFTCHEDLVEFMFIFDLYFLVIGLILELIVSSRVRSEHHILADLLPPERHGLRVRVVETVGAEGSEVLLQKIHERAATFI